MDGLRALGCDVVQGYHLSRPLPPEQVLGWVARREAGLPAQRAPLAAARIA
ncbi:MAG: hypothetical protein M3P46_00310 [Actinomycetota bacterium]|nr:hypothetical protein [Actinomycetota bacterium]